jgi:hypothetical protein
MTDRDTILRWLFPPADDAAAWCAVKAALFTIAGCAGALLALHKGAKL